MKLRHLTMEFAGCDPGPLRDKSPPATADDNPQSELATVRILRVDCKQGAVRAVRYSVTATIA